MQGTADHQVNLKSDQSTLREERRMKIKVPVRTVLHGVCAGEFKRLSTILSVWLVTSVRQDGYRPFLRAAYIHPTYIRYAYIGIYHPSLMDIGTTLVQSNCPFPISHFPFSRYRIPGT